MKAKHVLWFIAAIVAIVSMAAGVAVLIDRFLGDKADERDYIECDCGEEPDFVE